MGERPIPVGLYEVLTDYECPTASVRVFRMKSDADAVGGHVHKRSMQIYVALEGSVTIDVDGLETELRPFQALPVWPGQRHTATPLGSDVLVMNISVPPLAEDDQVPVASTVERPDMRLPTSDDDAND